MHVGGQTHAATALHPRKEPTLPSGQETAEGSKVSG
jgi:hypothetical protein